MPQARHPELLDGLDLGRWKVAFNGAEPVRAATLRRFTETFAPVGFRREALYPCYGLAEATLIVTGGSADTPPVLAAAPGRVRTRARPTRPPSAPGGRSPVRPW